MSDPYGDAASPSPEPALQPPDVSHHRGRRTWVIAGVAVVVLVVGAFVGVKATSGGSSHATTAAAQGPNGQGGQGRGRNGTFGTLQSIDGSTLTIATGNGSTTVATTSSSTKFSKTVTGAFSDIKVGDRVVAMGTASGTNEVAAERITDSGTMDLFGGGGQGRRVGGNGGPPPSFRNGGSVPNSGTRPENMGVAGGTVKTINGTTLTAAGPNGQMSTITTTPSTAVSVTKQVSLNDLTVGQPVVVRGTPNSDGTVTATAVQEGAGGFGRRFGGQGGQGGGSGGPGSSGSAGGTTQQ